MNRKLIAYRRQSGFTLVELLVVIAIIGVLVSLLFPAVNAVRRAARRTQNANNLQNIGLALQHYEQAKGTYPPLVRRTKFDSPDRWDHAVSWAFELLPYLEQQAIYDSWVPEEPVHAPVNQTAMATPVDTYANPNRRDPSATGGFANGPSNVRGTILDYAANFGQAAELQANPDAMRESLMKQNFDPKLSGPFSLKLAVAQAGVRDGITNTLAIGDRWIGPPPAPGATIHDQAGLAGSSLFTILRLDNPEGETGPVFPLGKVDQSIYKFGSPIGSDACFVFLDRHVQWISYEIDPVLFRRLCRIADGGVIPADAL